MSSPDRPISVALVVRPATGGMRKHVETLAIGLDPMRFQPTLFVPADFEGYTSARDLPRVDVPIGASSNPVADIRAVALLASRLRGFDLVHAHGLRGALVGVLAARRAGLPSIFTAHNLVRPTGIMGKLFFRVVGNQAIAVIAVSNAVADTLTSAGVPADRITVIPNGVDLVRFGKLPDQAHARVGLGLPRDAPTIVAIGRLAPEKGFDVAIEAFKMVVQRLPNAHLVIAGAGDEEAKLRSLATDLPGVHFLGRVPNVNTLLAACDLVVVPSREEGQGIAALEAMAAAKPVVASRVGGIPETVIDGETGLLVAPNDPAALAVAIFALLTNPDRSVVMGIAGRERVVSEFDERVAVDRVERLYESVLHH